MKSFKQIGFGIVTVSFLNLSVAEAGFSSPFGSTVEGIDIPNTHLVGESEGQLLRGMAPGSKLEQLYDYGVTDFLVFKNQHGSEVSEEIQELLDAGFPEEQIHHIPFKWKGIKDQKNACRQTLEGLRVLRDIYRYSGAVGFFHCTVGEDRTGLLAGVFRMLADDWGTQDAFKNEMCENGYGAGNPQKPWKVVKEIRANLTPLFYRMSMLVKSGAISMNSLEDGACDWNESFNESFKENFDASSFVCKKSTKYHSQ